MKRSAQIQRQTKETDITVSLHLDGSGIYDVNTGVGFLDHMLTALAAHALFDLNVQGRAHVESVYIEGGLQRRRPH